MAGLRGTLQSVSGALGPGKQKATDEAGAQEWSPVGSLEQGGLRGSGEVRDPRESAPSGARAWLRKPRAEAGGPQRRRPVLGERLWVRAADTAQLSLALQEGGTHVRPGPPSFGTIEWAGLGCLG